MLNEIWYFINQPIAQDFYHETMETIFELTQGCVNPEFVDVFINNGLINVFHTALVNFGEVEYDHIKVEFNMFYADSENIYDTTRKAYRTCIIVYNLLNLDLPPKYRKEMIERLKDWIPPKLIFECMKWEWELS